MSEKTVADMIGEAKARIAAVSPRDAADQVAAGKAVFLDVREPVEWEHHIEGAVQVPRGPLEFVADPASPKHKPELDPACPVIVYCRSGSRAALACVTLEDMGFGNIHAESRLHQERLRRGRVGAAGVLGEGGRGSAQGRMGAKELGSKLPAGSGLEVEGTRLG